MPLQHGSTPVPPSPRTLFDLGNSSRCLDCTSAPSLTSVPSGDGDCEEAEGLAESKPSKRRRGTTDGSAQSSRVSPSASTSAEEGMDTAATRTAETAKTAETAANDETERKSPETLPERPLAAEFRAVRQSLQAGDLEEALEAASKLISLQPSLPAPLLAQAWFLRGVVHDVQHQHEEVRACMLRALRLQPDFAEARLFLAEAHYRSGDFFAALEDFRAAEDSENEQVSKQAASDASLLLRNLRVRLRPARGSVLEAAAAAFRADPEEHPLSKSPTAPPSAIRVWDGALSEALLSELLASVDELCTWRVKNPSKIQTFWLPTGSPARVAAEVAGRALLRLLGHEESDFLGIEWWCRNQPASLGAHFHYDTDLSHEARKQDGSQRDTPGPRPTFSSVLYLSDVGGPTLLLDQVLTDSGHSPAMPEVGASVAPRRGRWLAFPGELRHAALALEPDARQPRFVLLFNYWKEKAPSPPSCRAPDFASYAPVCEVAPTRRFLLQERRVSELLTSEVAWQEAGRPSLLRAHEVDDVSDYTYALDVPDLPAALPMPPMTRMLCAVSASTSTSAGSESNVGASKPPASRGSGEGQGYILLPWKRLLAARRASDTLS